MPVVEVVVCSICEELGKDTLPYEIAQGDRRAVVDLCKDDAKLLESLLADAPAVAPRAKPRRRRGGRGVTTMEEIEREKRETLARKTP